MNHNGILCLQDCPKKLLISFNIYCIFDASFLLKTDYYFMSPGPPYQWDIDYGDFDNYEFDGIFINLL
jgi:hypothetical protein